MFQVMIVENLHEERMRRMDALIWERDALHSVKSGRQPWLARMRHLVTAPLHHPPAETPRRPSMAS